VRRETIGTLLFAAGAGWTGGNVGPVVGPIASHFAVSLGTVGLLMTVFFAAIALITVIAAPIGERLGVGRTIQLACALLALGNIACAATPAFAGLLLGRVLVGLGAGLAFVVGPAAARATGGMRLLGVFGGAVMLGIALALAIGSGLVDAGAGWRVSFVVSTAAGAAALPAFAGLRIAPAPRPASSGGFVSAALRRGRLWLLMLLFIHVNGITLVVSTWLIHYLTAGGMAAWLAGVLGFALFAITALMRRLGGGLAESETRMRALGALTPVLAAAGLAMLAVHRSLAVALPAIVLMGIGFALPYAVMIEWAGRLYPRAPAAAIAFLQTGPNIVPMAVVPLIGSALDSGHGAAAFLALAAFSILAGLANTQVPARQPGRAQSGNEPSLGR
jgi:predicted MFS family arabinose efflux permease